MISAHAYPTFELSDAVLLLAKAAARERSKAGAVSGNPLLSGNPLSYLTIIPFIVRFLSQLPEIQ